jgi:hypothetical protein
LRKIYARNPGGYHTQEKPKTLENRARRLARRLGLRVHKSQWRIGTKDNRGRFQVLDPKHERIIAGEKFDLTAEGVIVFCQKWVAKGRGA